MLQAPFERDAAAVGEVLVADLRRVAKDGDVDRVGAAVLAVFAARALCGEAQPSDLGSGAVVELGGCCEPADVDCYLELGRSRFCGGEWSHDVGLC